MRFKIERIYYTFYGVYVSVSIHITAKKNYLSTKLLSAWVAVA